MPSQDLKVPEPWHGRAQFQGRFIHKFLLLLPSFYHTNISPHPNFSLKPPYPTNFKPLYLPKNLTDSQKNFTQSTPNIIPIITLQSQTNFIHPNQKPPKFVTFITLTQKPQIHLHNPTHKSYLNLNPITKPTFPTQNLSKPHPSPNLKQSQQGQWHPKGKERKFQAQVMEEVASKQPQRITASHLALRNNRVCINIFSLNLCIIVGTQIIMI